MPFCGSCGNENPAGNSFCASCGSSTSGTNGASGALGLAAKPQKSPQTMELASTILGIVGGGFFAIGWFAWRSIYALRFPSDASWLFTFLCGVCWIVGLSLPWKQVKRFVGAPVQIIGFVSICVLTLGALIGLLFSGPVPEVFTGLSVAGLTTAAGIFSIPKVRARATR